MPTLTRFIIELVVIVTTAVVTIYTIDRLVPGLSRTQAIGITVVILHILLEILGINAYYARTYN